MIESVQKGKPMIIVIDGINQIRNYDNAKLLNWLPQSAQKVKYLFSTLEDDETMQTFHRCEYPIYTVEDLDEKQRQDFIVEYLEKVGKHLSPSQLTRILKNPENENTLVLKTLLDELICFGSYEHLDERIDYYLSAPSIPDFFERMLQRMEEDYTDVKKILSLIAVSENGLSEDEIIAITGMRQMDFHMFYCAFSKHLITRDGLLNFAHQYISDAVWNRYTLKDLDSAKDYRKDIIRYFSTTEIADNNRKILELAFQYYHTGDCDNLYHTILCFEAFNLFYATNEGRILLGTYWKRLRMFNSEKYQLRNYLDLSFDDIALNDLPYLSIGVFSNEILADSKTALMYFQTYLQMAVNVGQKRSLDVANAYNNIGEIYREMDDFNNALDNYALALEIWEHELGTDHPMIAISYDNFGGIYFKKGDYERAINYFTQALCIHKKKGEMNPDSAVSYTGIGAVYDSLGNYDKALEYAKKALAIYERKLGLNHYYNATQYNNIGRIYTHKTEYDNALKFYYKALDVLEKVFGKEHPDIADSYYGIGEVYAHIGNYKKALDSYHIALNIIRKIFGEKHSNTALIYSAIGEVLYEKGKYNRALDCEFKALEIRKEILGATHPNTAKSYVNIGLYYKCQGKYDTALEYYSKGLTTFKKLKSNHPNMATLYNNMGQVYESMGNYEDALDFYNKSLTITESNFGQEHIGVAIVYH